MGASPSDDLAAVIEVEGRRSPRRAAAHVLTCPPTTRPPLPMCPASSSRKSSSLCALEHRRKRIAEKVSSLTPSSQTRSYHAFTVFPFQSVPRPSVFTRRSPTQNWHPSSGFFLGGAQLGFPRPSSFWPAGRRAGRRTGTRGRRRRPLSRRRRRRPASLSCLLGKGATGEWGRESPFEFGE